MEKQHPKPNITKEQMKKIRENRDKAIKDHKPVQK